MTLRVQLLASGQDVVFVWQVDKMLCLCEVNVLHSVNSRRPNNLQTYILTCNQGCTSRSSAALGFM